jgi:hypothetical protein
MHAYYLGLGDFREPGPGFIFFLAGVALTVLSAIDLLVTVFLKAKKDESLKQLWSGVRWQKIVNVPLGLCAWAFFLDWLGFNICTLLLMIFLFRIVEKLKWWITISSSCLIIATSYLVFMLWLDIPLPRGEDFLGFRVS